jgi:hypothetical protein
VLPSQQNNHKLSIQNHQPPQLVVTQRTFEKEENNKAHQHPLTNRISEKHLDDHKLLLESLSNLPQNLLQSWIQSGQLQVTVEEGNVLTF